MRTLIKSLMLIATVLFVGVNILSFVAGSKAVQQGTAENDPELGREFTDAKSKLDAMVADRALVERLNAETHKLEWSNPTTGKADDEANSLQVKVNELALKLSEQGLKAVGAVTGAGIFASGMLCVSAGIWLLSMLVLGVLYFVFKPNTATIKVKHVT